MCPSFHGIFQSLGQKPEEKSSSHGQKSSTPATVAGQIPLDIYEQDNYYIIRVPLAGVHLSDLDIEVSDNVLTIRGVRRQVEVVPEQRYYLQECFWGEFSRSVTLPCAIDSRRVKATFNKDSILKILIPREERVKVVRISES